MKQIPLTKDMVALVDDSDFDWLSASKWHAHKDSNTQNEYYAMRKHPEKNSTQAMHRVILGLTDPEINVDHINGNRLDNQRHNLRICSHAENMRNMKLNSKNTSGFKGVVFRKDSGLWRARITFNGKRITLGHFNTAEEAAHAYNEACIKYHRDFARPNTISNFQKPAIKTLKPSKLNSSGFRGVSFIKSQNRFRATIQVNKKSIIIGSFKTAEEAASAYNQKAVELLGGKARLNDI